MPLKCVVLAAGASRRFGSPKQLHEYEGEPLVRRAVRTAAAIAPVIVVVPPLESELGKRIARALSSLEVTLAPNPAAHEGIASSIRCGVAACDSDVLITLIDQPLITAEHLRALASAGSPIAATGYRGIAGVPAFFAAEFRGELLALQGDTGARKVIEAHREVVVTVPFEDAGFDIDRP